MSRVLLLESDKPLAATISQYFKRAGHTVDAHAEPQAAVLAADKAYPDAVILDLQLAGRSGIEFLYEFRSYPEWQDTPTIVLCGLSGEELAPFKDSLAQLNVSDCLYKPSTSLSRLLDYTESLLRPVAA